MSVLFRSVSPLRTGLTLLVVGTITGTVAHSNGIGPLALFATALVLVALVYLAVAGVKALSDRRE